MNRPASSKKPNELNWKRREGRYCQCPGFEDPESLSGGKKEIETKNAPKGKSVDHKSAIYYLERF